MRQKRYTFNSKNHSPKFLDYLFCFFYFSFFCSIQCLWYFWHKTELEDFSIYFIFFKKKLFSVYPINRRKILHFCCMAINTTINLTIFLEHFYPGPGWPSGFIFHCEIFPVTEINFHKISEFQEIFRKIFFAKVFCCSNRF